MSKIKKQDYYFGAALFMFLSKNNDARPSIVEVSDASSRQCNMTTDTSEDFCLYMKYAGSPVGKASEAETSDGRIWQFSFSDADKERIGDCIASGRKTYIILICGYCDLSDGEIAVRTQREYTAIAHKTTIRIKAKKSGKKYVIVDRIPEKSLYIDRNRFDNRLTDIVDSI